MLNVTSRLTSGSIVRRTSSCCSTVSQKPRMADLSGAPAASSARKRDASASTPAFPDATAPPAADAAGKPSFASFDILSDEEIRAGVKAYSNWPTYPQLYVKGQLVGGLDIMKEMGEDELRAALQA